MLQKSAFIILFMRDDDDDKDDVNDDESDDACYRTATTSRTSSIACVDVCVEFPITETSKSKKKKENSNRACRSQPYNGEEIDSKLHACERACLDAHATSAVRNVSVFRDAQFNATARGQQCLLGVRVSRETSSGGHKVQFPAKYVIVTSTRPKSRLRRKPSPRSSARRWPGAGGG